MTCSIPLQLATTKTYLSTLGPCALVLVVLLAFFLTGKASTPLKKAALLGAVLINIGIAGYFVQQAVGAKLVVSNNVLTAKAGLDSVGVPLADLRLDDLVDAAGISFPVRTKGTSIGGMSTGWFVRHNGRKAFLLRSSDASTLIPTRKDFDLVVPASSMEQLLACSARVGTEHTTAQ